MARYLDQNLPFGDYVELATIMNEKLAQLDAERVRNGPQLGHESAALLNEGKNTHCDLRRAAQRSLATTVIGVALSARVGDLALFSISFASADIGCR